MRRIITGATGLIGTRLIEDWFKQNHAITVVGRSKEHIKAVFGSKVQAITWQELTAEILKDAEVVVNLAGASIGDKRWNETRKQEILHSRIDTTKKIAGMLAELGTHAPRLFNASAIGVYGLQSQLDNQLPVRLDESDAIDWDHPTDFLSQVAREWEKAAETAIANGVHVTFLRFGVVLAKEGGALPKLVQPFQFCLGGPVGSGNQPFTWITIDDLIAAIDFLLTKPDVSGPVNLVSPDCVMQKTLAKNLATVLHRPAIVPMPAFALQLLFGKEMAQNLLLEGQNVYPKRLLDLGFRFAYPDIKSALLHVLKNKA